jgi:integrase
LASEKINFSRSALRSLPSAPAGKRAYYYDTKESGLVLCVTPGGTKSFQIYVKVSGIPARVTLGRFSPNIADSVDLPSNCKHGDFMANTPELNVRMARSLAPLVKFDLKAGVSAADTKKAKRGELTLEELFEEYVTRHLESKNRKSTKSIRSNFERYLGKLPNEPKKKQGAKRVKPPGSVNWSARPISSITRQEVKRLHTDLGKHIGHRTANVVTALIRAMYNRAIYWEDFKKDNPAAGVEMFSTPSRERFMQKDEIPRFFAAVAQEPNTDIRDFVLLDLLTGARKGNALSMRWADISFDRAEWRIPDTKNDEALTVPLMAEAVAILQGRKPKKAAEFVFPGRGKSGHMADPRKGWIRIFDYDELNQLTQRIRDAGKQFEWPATRKKGPRDNSRKVESLSQSLARARKVALEMEVDTTGARIGDLHVHDLRRTLGSWQAATGASLVVIGKSLGHRDQEATAIYARLNIEPVRASVERATGAILEAAGVRKPAEVIPIKKARNSSKEKRSA